MIPARTFAFAALCAVRAVPALAQEPSPTLDRAIDFLERKVRDDPRDFIALNLLGERLLANLRLTGDFRWLRKASECVAASAKAAPARVNPGSLSIRARVELAQHRFQAALATGRELQAVQPRKSAGALVVFDAQVELGEYAEAAETLADVVRLDGAASVAAEARAAKLDWAHGRLEESERHLHEAVRLACERPLQAEPIAWCHVQLGELAFKQGQWDDAERAYGTAAKALPAWYVTEEHMAELMGARGQFAEAAEAYKQLVARVARPELFQAYGDLLVFAGRREEAEAPFARARALYEASLAAGETHYLHHAGSFYADSLTEPARALELARQDIESRRSSSAWAALAWAQYKSNRIKDASESITKALATGIKDPHVLYHASMIRMSAGDIQQGKALLQQSMAVNPRYNTFHAHR